MADTPAARRAYYEKTRAKGLCGSCAKRPAQDGLTRCSSCETALTEMRLALIAARLCVTCKAQIEDASELTTCEPCSAKERVQATSERNRRKAAGLCAFCGKKPPLPNRTLCKRCKRNQAMRTAKHRAKNRKLGLCTKCGQMALSGLDVCYECREKRRAYGRTRKYNSSDAYAKRKAERTAAGLCQRCGRRPPESGKISCAECAENASLYRRVHRARRVKIV